MFRIRLGTLEGGVANPPQGGAASLCKSKPPFAAQLDFFESSKLDSGCFIAEGRTGTHRLSARAMKQVGTLTFQGVYEPNWKLSFLIHVCVVLSVVMPFFANDQMKKPLFEFGHL